MFKFEKLLVYQKALKYVERIYLVTKEFPKEEKYGLVDQLRRASVSITTNIAEGSGRYHTRDYTQFLRIARSSLHECVALLKISLDQQFITSKDYSDTYDQLEELARMISGLMNSISAKRLSEREEV